MIETLHHIDQQWLLYLNGLHSEFFDRFMYTVSGKYEWIPLYAILLGFIIWKYRWKSLWILLGIVVLITLSDQTANLLKDGVKRFRPCKDPGIGHLVHLVNDYCRSSYGFVSGHAANSFALATFFSLLFRNRWVTAGMVFWASLVSYSRIYLGVHYPGDVLCGALLGVILAVLIYNLLKRLKSGPIAAGNSH
ncbi:MAG: phosphatase PAP2 family protein [Bacteroidales bacterium]|nr:phosphatase PAP2 family protein [Bacteroidales bacterium]